MNIVSFYLLPSPQSTDGRMWNRKLKTKLLLARKWRTFRRCVVAPERYKAAGWNNLDRANIPWLTILMEAIGAKREEKRRNEAVRGKMSCRGSTEHPCCLVWCCWVPLDSERRAPVVLGNEFVFNSRLILTIPTDQKWEKKAKKHSVERWRVIEE